MDIHSKLTFKTAFLVIANCCRWSCALPCNREATVNFNVIKKFSGKCNNVLTRFDGNVHSIIYWIEDRDKRNSQGDPLIYEVQKGPYFFLNYFSEDSLGVSGFRFHFRLGQLLFMFINCCLYQNNYLYTINPLCHLAKISKFQHAWSLTIHLLSTWCDKEPLKLEQ